jgi:hypothetical protein
MTFGADADAPPKRKGVNVHVSNRFHEQRVSWTKGSLFQAEHWLNIR